MGPLELAALYGAAGLALALRARPRTATDLALTALLWPLWLPLSRAERRPAAAPIGVSPAVTEHLRRLGEALDAARAPMRDGPLAATLPTAEHIARLGEHLARLDTRVQELDAVLATEEFDPARAERRLREAERGDGEVAVARVAAEGARRLGALRERARRERDELLSLCERLRVQVTVLRFAEAAEAARTDDLADLVAELLGRVEGAGEALGESAR